jgi:hypothetical protein
MNGKINKKLKRRKVPKEVAVFVEGVENFSRDPGYHHVVHSPDGKTFLLHKEESLPAEHSICILRPTYELPLWWPLDGDDEEKSTYAFDGTIETLTTWRVKK